MAGDDDEMFITTSLNVTPKTTEQHLIARSDNPVTIKNCARRFVLLKLASCGLFAKFATAELILVAPVRLSPSEYCHNV